MNTTLFLGILFGMAFIYALIGIFSAYKIRNMKDFFLADRNLGVWKLTFTLIATQLGSGMLLGTTADAYKYGAFGILYVLGISAGFLLLGFGLAGKLRSLQISTTAEIFETVYKSPGLKLAASLLSIMSLWGLFLAQVIALKHIFIALKITNSLIFICFWLFLIFYTTVGGLASIAIINSIQVLFIVAVFGYIFYTNMPNASSATVLAKINKIHYWYMPDLPSLENFMTNLKQLLPTFFGTMLFTLIEQDLAQRFFAAKNKFTATAAAFLSSGFILCFACIPVFFGIMAKVKKITCPAGTSPLIPLLEKICSPVIFILAICAIIAAITSTADSLLCAASSNISQDFLPLFPKVQRKLLISRIVSFVTGISALTFSFYTSQDILSIIVGSYRITVSCLFVPTLIAYFAVHGNQHAALASMILGGSGLVYVTWFVPYSIFHDIIPLIASLSGYILVAGMSTILKRYKKNV
jgi:SSS family solute:Na+ symporter